jgi:hypothetical protein
MLITVTDPEYFTGPVEIAHKLRKLPDRALIQVPCSTEGAKMYLNTKD